MNPVVIMEMPQVSQVAGMPSSSEEEWGSDKEDKDNSSSESVSDGEKPPAAKPQPKRVPRNRRGIMILGREFFELCPKGILSGLSIRCSNPAHEDCFKDCHGIKTGKLAKEEVARRLLAWGLAGASPDIVDRG
eukprot:2692351-Lingulodinium_polyedra.AAC.1